MPLFRPLYSKIRAEIESLWPEIVNYQRRVSASLPVVCSIPIAPRNVLNWLRSQTIFPLSYWSDREQALEIAGIGRACSFQSRACELVLNQVTSLIEQHPQKKLLNFLGGGRFRKTEQEHSHWGSFPGFELFLPQIALVRRDDDYELCLATSLGIGETVDDVASRLDNLYASVNPQGTLGQHKAVSFVERKDNPSLPEWRNQVKAALEAIDRGMLSKVVLARETSLLFSERRDVFSLLDVLRTLNQDSYLFLFAPEIDKAFFSVSPECLCRVESGVLFSEALGGTGPRGTIEAEDLSLGEKLSANPKIQREHALVVDELLVKSLKLTKSQTAASVPDVIKLADVQHLRTKFSGVLRPDVSLADVIATIHPTSAVCGKPMAQAMEFISRNEQFSRGWYSGPVGYVSADVAEFAVGIRSGIVLNKKVVLYAGAGIVQGSTPECEWEELENKIRTPLRVLQA